MTTGGGKVEAKEGCMIMTGMMITMTAEGKGRAEAKTIDTMTTTEARGKAKITAITMTTDTAGHQQLPVLVPDHQNVAHLSNQMYTFIKTFFSAGKYLRGKYSWAMECVR